MLKKVDPCVKKSFLRHSDSLGAMVNEEIVAVAMRLPVKSCVCTDGDESF